MYIPVLEISYEIRVCVLKLTRALWFKITLGQAQFFNFWEYWVGMAELLLPEYHDESISHLSIGFGRA